MRILSTDVRGGKASHGWDHRQRHRCNDDRDGCEGTRCDWDHYHCGDRQSNGDHCYFDSGMLRDDSYKTTAALEDDGRRQSGDTDCLKGGR